MLIDPFVVIAQIINFLILVALLKRFLYQPITQAMKARAQRIERQLATAAAKEQDAEIEKKLYLHQQQELEAQKQGWLEQAKQEVEQEKAELAQQARSEINQASLEWYKTLEQERQKFTRELRDRLSQQIAVATRKALSDLANADLEAQIIEIFMARLCNLERMQPEAIGNLPHSNPHQVVTLRSSFLIPEDKKERLLKVIQAQIAPKAEVQFERVENLICGIELRARGYKVAWNVEHYLTELETATAKFLVEKNHYGDF